MGDRRDSPRFREVERIVLVTDDGPGRAVCAPRRGCRTGWSPSFAGGARRQESVAAGVRCAGGGRRGSRRTAPGRPRRRSRVSSTTAPGLSRAPDLVRRVAAAAARFGAAIPVVPVVETLSGCSQGAATAARSAWSRNRGSAAPRRGPDAAGRPPVPARDVRRRAIAPDRRPRMDRRSGAARGLYHPGPCNCRRTGEPQGDAARGPPPSRSGPLGGLGRRASDSGRTTHAFGPGRPLALGGIRIPDAPRLAGHSDGDVVLHAIADALLGAAALGDLGQQFPADASTPEGIASTRLLSGVVDRLAAGGLAPAIDRRDDRRAPGPGSEPTSTRCATAIAALLGLSPACGQRQGIDRQPRRRRGSRTRRLRARRSPSWSGAG